LTAAGAVYCWGISSEGQGTTAPGLTPGLVAGGVSFAAVSVGNYYTCGVTAAGAAYCWGNNGYGQLGDGTTTDRSSPVLGTGGVAFAAVSAGVFPPGGAPAAGAAYAGATTATASLATEPRLTGQARCSWQAA